MHKLILVAAAFILLQSCNTNDESKPSASDVTPSSMMGTDDDSGWVYLFNGKSMDQWHSYGKPGLDAGWTIQQDSVLYLDTAATVLNAQGNRINNNIVTNDEYGNFDLKLDWKISEKGNSGVIFYVKEDTALYHENYNSGMEMQVLDNGTPTRLGHPDGKIYSHRAGDLYDLLAAKDAGNSLGEWNHAEIVANNGTLDFYLNGQHTLSTNMWDDNWGQMIAISKFKDMKDFGTFKQGKISLQDHGNAVWFKNIRVKKL